jgi:hypothetical protein
MLWQGPIYTLALVLVTTTALATAATSWWLGSSAPLRKGKNSADNILKHACSLQTRPKQQTTRGCVNSDFAATGPITPTYERKYNKYNYGIRTGKKT